MAYRDTTLTVCRIPIGSNPALLTPHTEYGGARQLLDMHRSKAGNGVYPSGGVAFCLSRWTLGYNARW